MQIKQLFPDIANKAMELNQYPTTIFKLTTKLLKLTDEYTTQKFIQTGERNNTINCFRNDIESFAVATAYEIIEQNKNKKQARNKENEIKQLLIKMGISI